MKVRFKGQVPKEPEYPEANEDVIEIEESSGRAALSDGASESYDSRTWARLLAVRFVRQPVIRGSWIAEVAGEYGAQVDRAKLSWSQEAALERGSFATLLGVEYSREHNELEVFGVGDSLAVLVDDGALARSFPYSRSEEFRQRPTLLSTIAPLNTFLSGEDALDGRREVWPLGGLPRPVVLLMTDALAEWALRMAEGSEPKWCELAELRTTSEFEAMILKERELGSLRVDDSTLVVLTFEESPPVELPVA